MAVIPPRPARAVRVHIDELRLEGFDPRHRYRIADAVERELVRLVTESSAEAHEAPRARERVDAGGITIHEGESPERVGMAIAQATFRAMHGEGGERGDRGGRG